MKNEDFYAPPQPYSQSLRTIAILLETRESDEDCVAQIKRFWSEAAFRSGTAPPDGLIPPPAECRFLFGKRIAKAGYRV